MTAADVDAVAALAQERRERYALYQPQFWRVASDATEVHRPFLEQLVDDDSHLTLIAADDDDVVVGFVIARLVPAPPVYDPGGPSGFIDDFVVGDDSAWATIGRDLLAQAARELTDRGAAQLVVVCGHLDEPKRNALASAGLSIASEWYVAPADRISAR